MFYGCSVAVQIINWLRVITVVEVDLTSFDQK